MILPQVVGTKTHRKNNSAADMRSEKQVTFIFSIFVKLVNQIVIMKYLVEMG